MPDPGIAIQPAPADLVSAFAEVVQAAGQRTALRDDNRTLTYRELDESADRLAGLLRLAGIGAGGRVALALNRSVEAVIAMLAVLKIGGAYVPLELDAPAPHLRALVGRIAPDCVLTDTAARETALACAHGRRVLMVSDASDGPIPAPSIPLPPSSPAYVMFTSGSTGSPKGVVVPHRAIVRLARTPDYLHVAGDDVFLLMAPLAFDASTFEIWGALLNGATLAIMPAGTPSLDEIAQAIEKFGVTTLWLTAGLFHLLVDARPEALRPLRWLLAGGDVLSPDHVCRALRALPNGRLINGYGPTENTTFSCCWTVPPDWHGTDVPIGSPIQGTAVHVLDAAFRPVPTGTPGELYVGGSGVALGYLDDPEASARVFLPDPFTGNDALLYRTGDLVREDSQGLLHFIGRIDDQIKVNGRRIDPAEIDAVLRNLPGVAQAAVLSWSPEKGHKNLCAFLVVDPGSPIETAADARRLLAERLPRPLLPTRIEIVPYLPLTFSGKIDRHRLLSRSEPSEAVVSPQSGSAAAIAAIWADQLGHGTIDPHANFFELGGSSLQLMGIHAALERQFPGRFTLTDLFDLPTVTALAAHLRKHERKSAAKASRPADSRGAIAIIGIAGRFPGAATPDALWENVRAGQELIEHFGPDEIDDPLGRSLAADPHYVRARSVLAGIELFDAEFFRILPREAALTDPQQRLFLELAWEAFEDAGYDPHNLPGAAAVFAGSSINTYLLNHILADPARRREFTGAYQVGEFSRLIGNGADFLATRTAYKLDLRGPAMTVQSACSTSLLAVAQACQSLQCGQADLALAGGVSITLPQRRGYLHQAGGMVSPDGHCRPFDVDAGGTVFGHGGGAVLLKRLADAIADRDTIHGVILGTGITNDGAAKVGYAAPSVDGQAEAIARAHDAAGISPDDISYVECHGTGTPLGDPIEIAALTRAFRRGTERRQFCAIGTAKANIGHLDVAAGVTGLIKTVLALRHREIPPLLHWHAPNPAIDFPSSPFFVANELRPWPAGDTPRRAGISAFGVGGTNVHLVVEEAPSIEHDPTPTGMQLFPLSARSDAALAQMQARLADHLETHPDQPLADVAFTLQMGRAPFRHRSFYIADSHRDLLRQLCVNPAPKAPAETEIDVDFLFPGQGAQHPGMGAGLHTEMPVYRQAIDHCADLLKPLLGLDLRHLLLADPADKDAVRELSATRLAQPAIFSVSWALTRLWASVGVRPAAMIGHSVGELVAACVADVMPLEDALTLVAARGEAMQALPPGRMLAVRMPEADLLEVLPATLDLAAVNGPMSCVVAGPDAAVADFEQLLSGRDIGCRSLRTSHAFHSRMMDPAVTTLEAAARKLRLSAPAIPIVSSVTGRWLTAAEAADPAYWARHLRQPVRFSDALATLAANRQTAFVEAGPGRTLSTLARQHAAVARSRIVLPSLRDPIEDGTDSTVFHDAVGHLWVAGGSVDWEGLHGGRQRRRVPLPTYPFERTRHWIDAHDENLAPASVAESPAPPQSPQLETPHMSENVASIPAIVADHAPVTAELAALIEEIAGIDASQVPPGASFLELGFDSLVLTQLVQAVRRQFGVEIALRQLTGNLSSPAALASHLAQAAPGRTTAPVAVAPSVAKTTPAGDPLILLMQEQLKTMQQMMAALLPGTPPAIAAAAAPVTEKPFGPFVPVDRSVEPSITTAQQALIDGLVERADRRTPGSKRLADQHRAVLADPRVAAGFRPEWKELVYPLTTVRSHGARIVDVDGNEYIDLLNGFGPTAFGHAPDFVTRAITEQLQQGFEIGPMTPLAGEVAALIRDLTGNERVTFCNTGSEAVMAAMRLARTVTGRDRIATFAGDYHGQFDEVLIKGFLRDGEPRVMPIAPGIPRESVANMVVLEHGSPESLAWLEAHGGELAAVLIEPVQSRHPGAQRGEFLRALRAVTERSGTALILDEIVTGFRVHPGGAQALFDVRADLVTYGKVVGGGMPIGVLAGKARFMNALDGGSWQYGDASGPTAGVTFFAGTFVRHPLALAAARAVLRHLKDMGPALQERLNLQTARLVQELNQAFTAAGAPLEVEHFGSVFYFKFPTETRLSSLFWYLLRERGIHHQEGFPCFLTTAHDEADIAQIVAAFADAAETMAEAGCFGEPRPRTVVPVSANRMTEAQMEIWLASQFGAAASCAFNELVTLTLRGPLDTEALPRALRRLVGRHDALRLRFARTGETFTVASGGDVSFRFADLHPLSQERREHALQAIVASEAETPFDLTDGPLIRFILASGLEADTQALIMTAHHIVCDGWSIGILLAELGPLYDEERTGIFRPLAPAPAFTAFAAQPSTDAQGSLRYWLDCFQTMPMPLDLPSDRPRPAKRSFRGGTSTRTISGSRLVQIRQASAQHGATLFATLLCGFSSLLARLSGQDELVVGIPVAAQSGLAPQDLVGHCVNFLPIRCEMAPGMSFADLLEQTRVAILDAQDHQACTFGTLVRELKVPRTTDRLPLIDVQFNLEHLGNDLAFENLDVLVDANPKAFTNFDLFLNVVQGADRLVLQCDYNSDLFDAATIDRWLAYYQTLLEAAADNMDQPMATLPLMTGTEHACVLDMLSGPLVDVPPVAAHELVARWAVRTPDKVALRCGGQSMSYAQLESAAERLAHRIAAAGVAADMPVAVLAERGMGLVVAFLAVLKTGAFYIPLDPANPVPRTEFMLKDCAAHVLVTAGTAPPVATATGLQIIRVEDDGLPVVARAITTVAPEALAYRIYTSGSTGRPKGVDIPHQALTNLLSAMGERPGIAQDDVLLAVTTPSFDIAALELFLPLVNGATVALARTEETRDGFLLRAALENTGSTIIQATPATWSMLLQAGWSPRPGLKMLCGGERLMPTLAARLRENGGELWNMYGPTETTIWSAADRLSNEQDIRFGRPIANTRFFVVDNLLQLVPPGKPGELAIGGLGLARGYHKQPELTKAKFRHAADLGEPVYLTGDRARLHPDGRLELLGRQDEQIKLHGYRIELGEIEAAMAEAIGNSRVAAALVHSNVTEGRTPEGAVLAGFIERGTGSAPPMEPEALRTALRRILPEWMIPARIVVLDVLPQTANGKLDRSALYLPDDIGTSEYDPSPPRSVAVPRNSAERILLAICRDVLNPREICLTDDLFELGVDSIQAFQIVARADRDGLQIDAAALLHHRTIEHIAMALNQKAAPSIRLTEPIAPVARQAFRVGNTGRHPHFDGIVSP